MKVTVWISNSPHFSVITHNGLFNTQVSLKFALLGAISFLAAFLRKHAKFSAHYAYCTTRNKIYSYITIRGVIHILLCTITEVACWVSTGERQAARIRGLYLKAVLRQDISYFDKETNTGEVVGRMSGDTLLIQEALGEKVLMKSYNYQIITISSTTKLK